MDSAGVVDDDLPLLGLVLPPLALEPLSAMLDDTDRELLVRVAREGLGDVRSVQDFDHVRERQPTKGHALAQGLLIGSITSQSPHTTHQIASAGTISVAAWRGPWTARATSAAPASASRAVSAKRAG